MVLFTSLLAIAIVLIPPKLVSFHPRHYAISIIVYWVLDVLKGVMISSLAYLIAGWVAAYVAAIVGVLVTLFWHKSNTVAVATGAILVLSPILILIGTIVFLISLFITRYYFLSTFFSIIAVIIFGIVFAAQFAIVLTILALGVLIILKHRHHFRRFRRGVEKQINW